MARLRVVTVVLGLALCGVLSSGATAMAATGSIEGTVTDDSVSPNPIPGAHVCFLDEQLEDVCAESNGTGYYALTGVAPGPHRIQFRAPAGQNYINQYYDDAQSYVDADPVTVDPGATVTGIDAKMHGGGTIAGIATEAGSGIPIPGLSVCASASTAAGEYIACTATGPGGAYTITGLPADPEYQVEFSTSPFSEGSLNFLTQYFNGKEGSPNNWDPVPVVVGVTTTGIDAAMKPGAQISGEVAEDGTGTALPGIEVCALDPGETPAAREFEQCAFTDATGAYTIRSLRAGTFVVVFSRARAFFDSDGFFVQWYDGASSATQATRIAIAPPQTRAGVDARLVSFVPHPKPPVVVVRLIEGLGPANRPPKCRKHFVKRKVKGQVRCVKVHRKRHHHRHHPERGPRAGTTGY